MTIAQHVLWLASRLQHRMEQVTKAQTILFAIRDLTEDYQTLDSDIYPQRMKRIQELANEFLTTETLG